MRSVSSMKKLKSMFSPPKNEFKPETREQAEARRAASDAREKALNEMTLVQQFEHIANGNLRHGDNILGRPEHVEHKEECNKAIADLDINGLLTLPNQAAVIMAKEDARHIATVIGKLKEYNIEMSNATLAALSLTGKNAMAFLNLLLNIQIMIQRDNLHINLDRVLKDEQNLYNLATTFKSVDANIASKLSVLFACHPFSIAALAKGFAGLIDKKIPITADMISHVDLVMNNNRHVNINRIFPFLERLAKNNKHALTSNHSSMYTASRSSSYDDDCIEDEVNERELVSPRSRSANRTS